MAAGGTLPRDEVVRIRVCPNRSLSPVGWWGLFIAFAALSMTIAAAFALIGAWLILPFAGLEVMAVGALFFWIARHAEDYEEIVVDEQQVRVVQHDGPKCSQYEFPRYWARVQWGEVPPVSSHKRLCIGSHGRFVEIGAGVNETARLALARRIRSALRY